MMMPLHAPGTAPRSEPVRLNADAQLRSYYCEGRDWVNMKLPLRRIVLGLLLAPSVRPLSAATRAPLRNPRMAVPPAPVTSSGPVARANDR